MRVVGTEDGDEPFEGFGSEERAREGDDLSGRAHHASIERRRSTYRLLAASYRSGTSGSRRAEAVSTGVRPQAIGEVEPG